MTLKEVLSRDQKTRQDERAAGEEGSIEGKAGKGVGSPAWVRFGDKLAGWRGIWRLRLYERHGIWT